MLYLYGCRHKKHPTRWREGSTIPPHLPAYAVGVSTFPNRGFQIADWRFQIGGSSICNLQFAICNPSGGCRGFTGPVPPPLSMSNSSIIPRSIHGCAPVVNRLPPECMAVQHATNLIADLVGSDRLTNKAIEPGVLGAQAGLVHNIRGDRGNMRARRLRMSAQPLQHREAIVAGQANVEQDQIHLGQRFDQLDQLGAIAPVIEML